MIYYYTRKLWKPDSYSFNKEKDKHTANTVAIALCGSLITIPVDTLLLVSEGVARAYNYSKEKK